MRPLTLLKTVESQGVKLFLFVKDGDGVSQAMTAVFENLPVPLNDRHVVNLGTWTEDECKRVGITQAPTFWITQGGRVLTSIVGFRPAAVMTAVEEAGEGAYKEKPSEFPHLSSIRAEMEKKAADTLKASIASTPILLRCREENAEQVGTIIDALRAELQMPEATVKVEQTEDVTEPELYVEGSLLLRGKECCDREVIAKSQTALQEAEKNALAILQAEATRMVKSAEIVVFIKGKKTQPFCRFSKQLVALLNDLALPFEAYDIFDMPDMRSYMKLYSEWPTFPQIYAAGNFVGGLDIFKDTLKDSGPDGIRAALGI